MDLWVSKFAQKNQFFWADAFRVCLEQEIRICGIEKEHKDVNLKQELQELNRNITFFFFNFFSNFVFFFKKENLKLVPSSDTNWYDPHQEIKKLVDKKWLQDHLEIDLHETTTCCLYESKNLGIMKMPQSIKEGLIDRSKENATEILSISSKSSKRTKENFLSQNYEWNLYIFFSISWWLFKYKEVHKFGN